MNVQRIEDAADPRIAAYRNIRERDLAGRHNRFMAEGKVVLRSLFSAGRFQVESALVLENRLDGLEEVLREAPPDLPVYVTSAEIMNRIAGFDIHRGVLACGVRRSGDDAAALLAGLGDDALVVAMVGISNHDNMGAIFRNAAAFAADAVLVDTTSCDPLYRKAIRVSVGAALRVPFAVGGDGATLADLLQRHGFRVLALSPRGARDISELSRHGRTALLLGTEGEGLPEVLLQRLETVRIPIAPGFDSLNVATSAAIALHRLWR